MKVVARQIEGECVTKSYSEVGAATGACSETADAVFAALTRVARFR